MADASEFQDRMLSLGLARVFKASALASASFNRNSISAALKPSHVKRWRRGKRVNSELVGDFAIKAVSIRGDRVSRKRDERVAWSFGIH